MHARLVSYLFYGIKCVIRKCGSVRVQHLPIPIIRYLRRTIRFVENGPEVVLSLYRILTFCFIDDDEFDTIEFENEIKREYVITKILLGCETVMENVYFEIFYSIDNNM